MAKACVAGRGECGRDGMGDAGDFKSPGFLLVWVRVPPPAPLAAPLPGALSKQTGTPLGRT